MKKIKQHLYKISFTFLVFCLMSNAYVAGEDSVAISDDTLDSAITDDQIALPDVSTELKLDRQNIEDAAIPDFTQFLPQTDTAFSGLPVLSDGTDEKIALEAIVQESNNNDNSPIYLEGIIGGGYPGIFIGNFNVSQTIGDNPFSLSFLHEAINGYGSHNASEGYNNSETSLSGVKTFTLSDKLAINGTALYNTSTWGLQSKSSYFYNMSRQYIGGTGTMSYQINDVVQLQTTLDASYDNRFAGFTVEVPDTVLTGPNLFTVAPKLNASIEKGNFLIDFSGSYKFASMDSSVDSNDDIMHHADINADVSYLFNDLFTLVGGVGGSFTDPAISSVVVPFYIGGIIEKPFLTLTAKGGLHSTQTDIAALQELYPYVQFEKVPTEESKWFGLLDAQIPFMQKYVTIINVEFNKTAFGNETLWPDYTTQNASGLYDSAYYDVTELITKMAFSAQFNKIGSTIGWEGNWLDKIEGTNTHEVYTDISYTTADKKGSLQLELVQSIISFEVPQISFSSFYQFAKPFQLELSLEDIVYLFTGDDRLIAGEYCDQGGSVSLKMKLFF
ncbi:MAG: hypothetical protein BKP49_05995 [Treponema sp. CETP13]|nr:MAG: hypothetical protein BKP49_05995 [Treponema sp. CETP13]